MEQIIEEEVDRSKENDISDISFTFKEAVGRLWEYEGIPVLFVSADSTYHQAAAAQFKGRFGIRPMNDLRWNGVGECVWANDGNVLLLVIQALEGEPANIVNITNALMQLKEIALKYRIKKLVIPQYGVLNDWMKIKNVIQNIFGDIIIRVTAVAPQDYITGVVMDPDTERQLYKKGLIARYYC